MATDVTVRPSLRGVALAEFEEIYRSNVPCSVLSANERAALELVDLAEAVAQRRPADDLLWRAHDGRRSWAAERRVTGGRLEKAHACDVSRACWPGVKDPSRRHLRDHQSVAASAGVASFLQSALNRCEHVSGEVLLALNKAGEQPGEPRGTHISRRRQVQPRPGG